jgi:hypothetical protein
MISANVVYFSLFPSKFARVELDAGPYLTTGPYIENVTPFRVDLAEPQHLLESLVMGK